MRNDKPASSSSRLLVSLPCSAQTFLAVDSFRVATRIAGRIEGRRANDTGFSSDGQFSSHHPQNFPSRLSHPLSWTVPAETLEDWLRRVYNRVRRPRNKHRYLKERTYSYTTCSPLHPLLLAPCAHSGYHEPLRPVFVYSSSTALSFVFICSPPLSLCPC